MLQEKLKNLQTWFEQQILLIKQYFVRAETHPFICYTGEVYFAHLGVNIGTEIDKSRPVMVFQSRHLRVSERVLVVPITSQIKSRRFTVYFSRRDVDYGELTEGQLLLDQMRFISKERFTRKLGRLNDIVIRKAEDTVKKILPLHRNEGGTELGA